MGDSGKVELDLNLPPPSPDKSSQVPEPTMVQGEQGGVRVAKVRPRKLVRLSTIRGQENGEDEKKADGESPAPQKLVQFSTNQDEKKADLENPAPRKQVQQDEPKADVESSAPDPPTPAAAGGSGTGTSAMPNLEKVKPAAAQVKIEKLGKKRGRQTVQLEINESLQIARPVKAQTTTTSSRPDRSMPPPPPPPLHAPRREVFESSEQLQQQGRREVPETPKEIRQMKPQHHRPNVRRNNSQNGEDYSRKRPSKRGGGFNQPADASIERLHREATSRKLWQDPNLDTELQRVPGSFASLEEYVQVFEPLLFEECRAQLYSTWEEIFDSGKDLHMPAYVKFVEKRDRGWYDITITPAEQRMRFSFKEGDVAVLSTPRLDQRRGRNREEDADEVKEEVSARIAGIIRRYIPLDVREPQGAVLFVSFAEEDFGYPAKVLEDLRRGLVWSLTTLGSLATTQREYVALHGLHRLHPQMINAILQPRPELFPHYDPEEEVAMPASLTDAFSAYLKANFNPPQLSAINWAAMHTEAGTVAAGQEIWPFSLVQGPPGTGKTHTVWGMLNAIHLVQYQRYYHDLLDKLAPSTPASDAAGEQEQGGWIDEVLQKMDRCQARVLPKICPKPRILVCAPSNAATDELLSRVMQREFMDGEMRRYRPDVARVGTDPQTTDAQQVSVEKRTEAMLCKSREEVHAWLQEKRVKEAGMSQAIAIVKMDLAACRLQSTVGVEPEALAARDHARECKRRHLASLVEERDKNLVDMSRHEILENIHRGLSIEEAKAKLEASFANEAEIVFTTVSSSGRKLFTNLTRGFDIIVIDEAAQASELGVLPPLILGSARCVLVGDPQQLPATVISRVADTMQYSRSLFERFQQAGCPTLMLTVQYRMHPQIRDFPSRHFYQGRLLDSESVEKLPDEVYHHDPLLQPFLFFDVSHGKESHMSGSVSLQNSIEAKFAARLFEHLQGVLRAAGKSTTVGVISPYKLQLRCLQKEFESVDAKGVYINTVDAFQGQERDVIIMSCVRASNHGVGFVADIRRMNVALTRARRSLWVIGNASTLLQSEDWAALIKDAKARKCFMTYSAAVEKGLAADGFLSKVLKEPKKEQQLRIGGSEARREYRGGGRGAPRAAARQQEDNVEKKTAESYLRQHNSMRKG